MAVVDVVVEGEGAVEGGGASCASECKLRLTPGTSLDAVPAAGWRFDHWGGVCEGNGSCTVNASGVVQAIFAASDVLVVEIDGSGTVSASDGRTCTASRCEWVSGTPLQLTAQASPGYEFAGFAGQCFGTGPCIVSSGAVKATFVSIAALEVVFTGDGKGTVRDSSGTVSCTQSCSVSVLAGSTWELDLLMDASTLAGAFEAPCTSNHCVVTAPARVVVHFEAGRRVSISLAGQGSGTVAVNGTDVCPGNCAPLLAADAGVRITARSGETSRFGGFVGACSGTADCELPPGAEAVAITARFDSALVWARSFPVLGGERGPIWAALYGDDGGVVAALSVTRGLEVDGVSYATPPFSDGSAMTLFLDWDGGTTAVVPLVDASNSSGFNGLTGFARGNGPDLVGFGACMRGDLKGTPCPTTDMFPMVVSFSDAGISNVVVRTDLVDGWFDEVVRSDTTLFGRFHKGPPGPTLGFAVYPTDLDGGATYEGPAPGGPSGPVCLASEGVICAVSVLAAPFAWQGCSSTSSGTGYRDLTLLRLDSAGQCSLLHRFASVSSSSYHGETALASSPGGGLLLAGHSRDIVDFGVSTTAFGFNHWVAWLDGTGVQRVVTAPANGGAIRSLAAGSRGALASGFVTTGSTFFGRMNSIEGAFIANFDDAGAMTRFWHFPNGIDVYPKMVYANGHILLLMVGSNVTFEGKPLAADSRQHLHIVMLEE